MSKILIIGYTNTAFLATIGEGFVSPVPSPIVFNVTQFNPGEHYDPETGIYTVPYDGVYMITATLRGEPDNDFGVEIMVDGVRTAENRNADAGGVGKITATISIILDLNMEQQFWINPFSMTSLFGGSGSVFMYSWFAGYLISAD